MKKGDVVIIIVVALLALLPLFFLVRSGEDARVIVRQEGKILYSLDLREDRRLVLREDWGGLCIEIRNGAVSVTESDCLNQICVHTAPITRVGQTIACLPQRVSIAIEGGEAEYDALSH